MDIEIGKGKTARRAYGLDEIAIVPSRRTRDAEDIDISWSLGDLELELPCMASALDAAVDPKTAGIIGQLGGLAVLNLEGIQTRYEDPDSIFEEVANLPQEKATRVMQELYQEPIKEELVFRRVQQIKDQGVIAAASLTPQRVEKYHRAALEAGLDLLVIQGTVVSAEHVSKTTTPLNLMEFIPSLNV
ncbi:MAG: GuaB3 family IMP dehydrogenase-related protein, partial [Rubrobacter sp.]|nr:GuaB3 family IMP dehydrogenase-related protein [Rubrobacter sp.]